MPKHTMEYALAVTLKNLRENNNLSASEASKIIGVSQPTISYWESARRTPSPQYLCNIANVYESTPSGIYSMAESEPIIAQAKQLEKTINRKKKTNVSNKDKK